MMDQMGRSEAEEGRTGVGDGREATHRLKSERDHCEPSKQSIDVDVENPFVRLAIRAQLHTTTKRLNAFTEDKPRFLFFSLSVLLLFFFLLFLLFSS